MLPTKFQVNWPLGSGEEGKNKFSRCPPRHLGFRIETILAIVDLQVIPMLPTELQVSWSFDSEEEAKNKFSIWPPWRQSWISEQNGFSYFWSTSHTDTSYRVSSQLAQGCRRSRLLKQIVDAKRRMTHDAQRMTHAARRTTDTDRSQQLTLSTSCSGELKTPKEHQQ